MQKKIGTKNGLLIAAVFSDRLKDNSFLGASVLEDFVRDRIKYDKFKAAKGEHHLTFLSEKGLPSKFLVYGAGKLDDYKGNNARNLGAEISKKALASKQKEVSVVLPKEFCVFLEEFLEGYMFIQYKCALYKTKESKKPDYSTEKLNIISESGSSVALEAAVKKALLLNEAMTYVRDLVNGPPNIVNSEYFALEAGAISKKNGYKAALLGLKELTKMKAGGILSVNQGCEREPRLLVMQYDGGGKKEKPIVLIGKGVIFDTGGYNLKHSGNIEQMHQDMSGGATILAIMKILKRLGIKKNIIGVVPVVENLINEKAYRPSDIITMLSGNTVEITNTDAEGRLILADAISYARELNPEVIVTIATLTGAALVALGHRYCAVIGNDESLRNEIQKAGDEVDDLGWPLPIHDDYRKEMESVIADFRNFDLGSGGGAGSAKGAAFLEKFVGENRWCHIDIGGTAFTSRPKPYEVKGSTAHGLRMLLKFLER